MTRRTGQRAAHSLMGAACAACALVLLAAASGASAQNLFRIVTPDGRVTYSDRLPADAAARVTPMSAAGGRGADDAAAPLPEPLRQAVARFPVTLYTTAECEPCTRGRALLSQRGVPYSEKTVSTQADVQALQRLAGTQSLPVLTIGGQQLRGFAESEWVQYLDLAGYPKTSQLPPSYRAAAATPLVPPQVPATATSNGGARLAAAPGLPPPLPAPALPGPTADNPTGIRF